MANFTPKNRRARNLEAAANAARALFLAVGIASTAFLTARLAFPCLLSLLSLPGLPTLWSHAISWLSPPYLFITVHFIIMVIWKLHRSQNPQDDAAAAAAALSRSPLADIDTATETPEGESPPESAEPRPHPSEAADRERGAGQQLPWPPPEPEPEPVPKDIHEDGLDETWRAIMSGKSAPVGSQLRKSDTWEKPDDVAAADARNLEEPTDTLLRLKRDDGDGVSLTTEKTRALARAGAAAGVRKFKKSDTILFRQRRDDGDHGDPASSSSSTTERREMRKSRTFRESTTTAGAGGGWRGREALVVGRDELFGRVEAFIKMNYEQMRLQRQESDRQKRFVEMVNATAY